MQPIELNNFQEIIDNFDKLVNKKMYNNQLYRLLQNKNILLQQTFSKINPEKQRFKRWDKIGTVWKWIAGTPDANDLHVINSTMNQLIENNNNQIFINQAMNGRIQHISKITNDLLELDYKTQQQHVIELNLITILLNIDTIQHQIEILEDAILLAKHGIPSSRILSIKDYVKTKKFLEQANIYVNSYEDLLSRSIAHVVMNTTHIMYMLKIPQLSNEAYDFEYIDPLVTNEKRVYVKNNYIIKNDSHIFETPKICAEESNIFICDTDVLQLPNQCIMDLIKIHHANCSYEKVYNTGIIKRINEATILLNNINIKLQSNCSNHTQYLKGSFLIQFEQCEIHLDNNVYTNFALEIDSNSYRPTTGLIIHEQDFIDVPPPEYLTNLTLNHRSMLQHVYLQNESLQWKLNLFGSISFGTISIIIIITIIYTIVSKLVNKNQVKVVIQDLPKPTAPEENQNLKITVNSPYPDIPDNRLEELNNYFSMATSERKIKL